MEGRWVENREKLGIGSSPSVFAMLVEAHLQTEATRGRARKFLNRRFPASSQRASGCTSRSCRLKGELLLARDASNAAQAEGSFRTAIDISRRQKAKSWELRAAMSLARLLDTQGRRGEARTMLADIYNWFTEGFDTRDLKDAKALLDDLS